MAAAQRYGISVGDIERLKADQQNRCAICNAHADNIPHSAFKHNPLVVDHDHKTGLIRGLLCPNCNAGLGQFKDSPKFLRAAAEYLER